MRINLYTNKIKNAIMKPVSKMLPRYKLNYQQQGKINFIDVGSIGGLPKPWNLNANHVKFLLNFEPNESPRSSTNFMTYNTALWESEDVLPFYVYKGFKATGSSLFKQNFTYVHKNYETLKNCGPIQLAETWFERSELIETRKIKCRPLDNILNEVFPHTPFHFLKIDAQGAEYNILKGAQSLLAKNCIGIHLEAFVLPLYENIMLLDDIKEFLAGFGFYLVKKFPPHGTFNSQHDCLFLHNDRDPVLYELICRVYNIVTKV